MKDKYVWKKDQEDLKRKTNESFSLPGKVL